MTSSIPFLLPLKANEAASLAELIFQQLESKQLNDEQRNRLNTRAASLGLTSIRPHWGSLQADPVHTSTYYLAVDGMGPEGESALLLRLALASAPASGIFPKSMLIGRMRPGGGREVVVNAVPFGPDDASVATFCQEVDKAFLPRPMGAVPAMCIAPANPDATIPEAFAAFREIEKTTGLNYAALEVAPEKFSAVLWSAVRAGWRAGYTVGSGWLAVPDANAVEAVKVALHERARFSKFSLDVRGHTAETAIQVIVELADFIRGAKLANRTGRAFDLEIDFGAMSPEDAFSFLQALRGEARPAQILRVPESAATEELAEAVRNAGAIVACEKPGRWQVRVAGDLSADDMISLASQLRG